VGWNTGFVPVLVRPTDVLLWPGGWGKYPKPLFTVLTWVENGVKHKDAVRIIL
jgi:hypothetical protein